MRLRWMSVVVVCLDVGIEHRWIIRSQWCHKQDNRHSQSDHCPTVAVHTAGYIETQGSCAWKPRTQGFGRHVTRCELAVVVRQMSPDASLFCFVEGVGAVYQTLVGCFFSLLMFFTLDASDTSGAIGILSSFFTAVPRRFCLQHMLAALSACVIAHRD